MSTQAKSAGASRLQSHYQQAVIKQLMTQFKYKSVMQVPRIQKITLNMGVGEAVNDKKIMDNAVADMTKIAIFDPFSGIAGDMTVGALLDAGAPAEGLLTALNELPTGARYEIEKTVRGGLAATKFRVHQEPHPARHRHLDHILKMIDGAALSARSKARALAVAKDVGMDMTRIEKDMESPEAKAGLEESMRLAETLGLNGTPSYVIGDNVIVGAIGLPGLREKINTSRCGKATC